MRSIHTGDGRRGTSLLTASGTARRFGRGSAVTLTVVGLAAATATAAVPAGAAAIHPAKNAYKQTNLIANRAGLGAKVIDPDLQNAWGMSFGPATPLWVSDNNSNVSTLYSITPGGAMGNKVPLTVNIPGGRASTHDGSSPTGQVFNGGTGFVIKSSVATGPARFIFASESGQISAWNPMVDPIMAGWSDAQLVFSSKTAVYKGLTMASTKHGTFLYASNFHDGTVDVFNSKFKKVRLMGQFRDRFLPRHYAPFGIQQIGGLIYVTYALQDRARHDDVAGPGRGFVDVFSAEGVMLRRVASRGVLNAPWGLAMAPAGFGRFSGRLLVGNFGDGKIDAFGKMVRHFVFLGQLRDGRGRVIKIDGLWGLLVGTAATGGTKTVLFSAGPRGGNDGLIGSLNAMP